MERITPIIDFHAHFLVRQVLEQCLPHSVATNRGHHQLPPHLFALFDKMMSSQGVIVDMDRLQIDMSVISSAAVIAPLYWAEASVALRLAQQLNDTAADEITLISICSRSISPITPCELIILSNSANR